MANGYVVSRPFPASNIGSNLSSLAGACWLAGVLDRELIVDWRGLSQMRDPDANYFSEFFEQPPTLLDVPVSYAPVDGLEYGPESPAGEWLDPGAAHELGFGLRSSDAEFVVLQPYHGLDRLNPGEVALLLRPFYEELRPAPDVRAAADEWWAEHFEGRFVVGVNIRSGNGHYFGKGMQYAKRVDVSIFENERRFVRVIEKAVRERTAGLPASERERAGVFYATDSAAMSELLRTVPNAVTRRGVFPPPKTGDTYRFEAEGNADRKAIADTLVDMFLLARCDAFIFNSSLFNQYARVMTGNFGGNEVHVEMLFFRPRVRALARRIRARAL